MSHDASTQKCGISKKKKKKKNACEWVRPGSKRSRTRQPKYTKNLKKIHQQRAAKPTDRRKHPSMYLGQLVGKADVEDYQPELMTGSNYCPPRRFPKPTQSCVLLLSSTTGSELMSLLYYRFCQEIVPTGGSPLPSSLRKGTLDGSTRRAYLMFQRSSVQYCSKQRHRCGRAVSPFPSCRGHPSPHPPPSWWPRARRSIDHPTPRRITPTQSRVD